MRLALAAALTLLTLSPRAQNPPQPPAETSAQPVAPAQPDRQIALTVDDLPGLNSGDDSAATLTAINTKLIANLQATHAPVIGFVNEEHLFHPVGQADARIAILSAWLDAGFDLGNHTFSHTSLNQVELKDWEDDVIQGENISRLLLTPRHKSLHYLRHPFLDAGPDLQTRRAAEAFLTGRGYRVAPVTIDTKDWFFSDLYRHALAEHDPALQQRTVSAWLAFNQQVFAHAEALSRSLLGYEPRQVLLLHECQLEADHLPELLALMHARGYKFISLDDALLDPAYAQPDTYISDAGATWLDHWAVTRGHPTPPADQPQIPAWAQDLHRKLDAANPD